MVWSSRHPSSAGLTESQEGLRRARPGDREGWPEAQRGGAGGHRPGARGPLGPLSGHNVLDCSTAWLVDREQWLAEGSGSQPNVGGSSLARAKAGSYNLSCHLGQGTDQLIQEAGRGPGALWGPQQSLPTLGLSGSMSPAAAVTRGKFAKNIEP